MSKGRDVGARKLTKTVVDSLPHAEAGQQYFVFDSELTGFGLRVSAQTKAFIVQRYITGTTKKQRLTLGRYPELTVIAAREEAAKHLGELARGRDIRAERKQKQVQGATLAEVFGEFTKTRSLKPGTLKDYTRCLDKLGWMDRRWTSVTRGQVMDRHREMTKDHGEAFANLTFRALRSVFNFAMTTHRRADGTPMLAENPCKVLSDSRAWNRLERRQGYLKPHELPAWFAAVNELGEPTTRDFLVFVLLTGLRRNEAASLEWRTVDLQHQIFTIQNTKNRTPHTLPLSGYLLDMLKRRRAEAPNSRHVFSSDRSASGHIEEPKRAYNRIASIMGRTEVLTVHDLRRTFITIVESLDISAYALKRLVNHKMTGDVTAGYIVSDVERLREPMQRVTEFVLKAAGVKPSAEVIQLVPKSA